MKNIITVTLGLTGRDAMSFTGPTSEAVHLQ